MNKGQLNWVFPDGDLPPHGDNPDFLGHEALTVTNLNDTDAHLTIDIIFEDKDPVKGLHLTVPAQRVICIRTDLPFCEEE